MSTLICDEHSSVLPEWWSRHLQAKTVVYFDAHLDLQHISPTRLDRLLQCQSVEAFRRLEKSHHLAPEQDAGYSIEDFLFPAHRLGIISRLVWVAPPHVEIGYSQAAIDQLQQMDAVQCSEIANFQRSNGGWIEGDLMGLPITICRYEHLHQLTIPADSLIDVDIDFFVGLPNDDVWVNPRIVCDCLRQLRIKPELVTISRSVNSGFTPLRFRFLADHFYALWEHRHADVDHYERLLQCEQRIPTSDPKSLIGELQCELERYPQSAACCYSLSRLEQDPRRAEQLSAQAATICADYRPSPLRSACEYLNRLANNRQASTIEALERQVTELPLDSRERELTRIAIGLLWCTQGKVERAVAWHEPPDSDSLTSPELSLEIGKLLIETQPDRAISFLQAALDCEKTRTAAHVYLSHCQQCCGAFQEAIRHLETAAAFAPAWNQLLLMLAAIHDQLGDHQQAQRLRLEYNERLLSFDRLARRMSLPSQQ